ncbi:ATP-binding protein [Chloroflexota bacterium]
MPPFNLIYYLISTQSILLLWYFKYSIIAQVISIIIKMFNSVVFKRFKQFSDVNIPFHSEGLSFIAGGNNSGKSTILHGLAIWQFCHAVILAEKGPESFIPGNRHQGLGIGNDEFSPINVPSLRHLWTNLIYAKAHGDPDGYTLRIKCNWGNNGQGKFLEFGLALANDRLFIKTTDSNLDIDDHIPNVAYLPPFAGMIDKEMRLPLAIRNRRIGEGLAGSVLRNVLLDLNEANARKRSDLRGNRTKILDSDLRGLRSSDSWELLQQALRTIFSTELVVSPFKEEYHSYIKIEIAKGNARGFRLTRFPGYKNRDLMVEGSGFLQWLSVFTLAADPSVDVLLLDEPDAHLHHSLQENLIQQLMDFATSTKKQILIATHSTEILKQTLPEMILMIPTSTAPKYLSQEHQKVGFLAGLGSAYTPRIDKVKINKRILFIESEADIKYLRKISEVLELNWPDSWVEWVNKFGHKERKYLFIALKEEIPDLVTISLRDRDDEAINTVGDELEDKNLNGGPHDLYCKKWRRRNIESYLIWPEAIAKATNKTVEDVNRILQDQHGIAIGDTFVDTHPPEALCQVDGKFVLSTFNANPLDVINNLPIEKIPKDIKYLISELIRL